MRAGHKTGNLGLAGVLLLGAAALFAAILLPGGAAASSEQVLYSFAGSPDGANPQAGLTIDAAGNLYGTTQSGGTGPCPAGCGTVFQVAPDGTETVLYSFAGSPDGANPFANLVMDAAGNLYGTTQSGGTGPCRPGCGTVFQIAPDGTETVLYRFASSPNGATPQAGLVIDAAGNLYGTTAGGGTGPCPAGCGTVFQVAPDGTETVLYRFAGSPDGWFPLAGLIIDAAGNLYGTTSVGGTGPCGIGCGTVFELAPDGTETVLYSFASSPDGAQPFAGLIMDGAGNLYGTTNSGGTGPGNGVVFAVSTP